MVNGGAEYSRSAKRVNWSCRHPDPTRGFLKKTNKWWCKSADAAAAMLEFRRRQAGTNKRRAKVEAQQAAMTPNVEACRDCCDQSIAACGAKQHQWAAAMNRDRAAICRTRKLSNDTVAASCWAKSNGKHDESHARRKNNATHRKRIQTVSSAIGWPYGRIGIGRPR